MPFHRRAESKPRVDGNNSGPVAPPRGTTVNSILSTGTRWGDFVTEFQNALAPKPAAASNQAAPVAPCQHQPPSQGRSHFPAKFPSFSPAAHQARGPPPRSRTPVANSTPAFPRTPSSSRRRTRGPVICELCKGLSDPNVSYPDVKRHLCSKCARIAFGEPAERESCKAAEHKRERRSGPAPSSQPTSVPRPPTPPVKDFADFNFAGSSVYPPTPSSTGSQPKFDAFSTSDGSPPPTTTALDPYRSAPARHGPRPPSSEYSHAPHRANPYASTMGNPFTSNLPTSRPPLPRLRTNLPLSTPSSYPTMSPTHPVAERHAERHATARSPRPVSRRSSFYRFYDEVLGDGKVVGGGGEMSNE